jgi:RNA polymerase sigma-70 factor (ECF subfamily)
MENIKNLTDEQVVKLVRTKNQELYVEIVRRYEKKLIRYAKYLVSEETKAVDVVQESFIKAFVNLNSFNSKMKFSTWIYRIVHNQAVNMLAKYKREIFINKDMDFQSNENLEENYSKDEIVGKISFCLSEIPLIYAEPLSLFYLEDKSYEEISDILRLPLGTVGTRINRAKILMRKICQQKK